MRRYDDDLVIRAAAARLFRDGHKQTAIGEVLGISQSQVSKHLDENPFIEKNFNLDCLHHESKEEFMSKVDTRLDQGNVRPLVRALSRSPYFKVDVFYSKAKKSVELEGFDFEIGRMISRLLERASTVGVAWDLTIVPPPYYENLTNFHRRDAKAGDKEIKAIQFVPLAGISVSTEKVRESSTFVAMRYNTVVNKNFTPENSPKLYNLNCIPLIHPAVVPNSDGHLKGSYLPDSKDVISYIEKAFPDYVEIFGEMEKKQKSKKPRVVDSVDTIITGIGAIAAGDHRTLDILYPENNLKKSNKRSIEVQLPEGMKEISLNDLKENYIVGEIAGILLPRPGKNYSRNCIVTERLNSRLATLRAEHLVDCHKRHLKAHDQHVLLDDKSMESPAGVVLVAMGADKADSVLCAIAKGYISRLIIDRPLERELHERVEALNSDHTEYLKFLGRKVTNKTKVIELHHAMEKKCEK